MPRKNVVSGLFILLFVILGYFFTPSAIATTVLNPPTNFLSCGSDYDKYKDQFTQGELFKCQISASIVDGAGKPIPTSAHPKLTFHVARGADDTQQEGDYSIDLTTTTSYTYCSFSKAYNERLPLASYPTAFTFHASADGYTNSPDFTMAKNTPCNDINTGQSFGPITLQKSDVIYGCYSDGACHEAKEKPSETAKATFGSDSTCNQQCGIWKIYDRSAAGLTGTKYGCYSDADTGKPDGLVLVPNQQTYYLKQDCDKAADGLNIEESTGTNPLATATPAPPPTIPPPEPPCDGRIQIEGQTVDCKSVPTGFGVSIKTDPAEFTKSIFSILLSLSGGIAILLIIKAGYQMMISRGDPEKIKEAREVLTSAIIGLLFLISSLVILEVIGFDILHIPGIHR